MNEELIIKVQNAMHAKASKNHWEFPANFAKSNAFKQKIEEMVDAKKFGKESSPLLKNIYKPFELVDRNKMIAVVVREHPFNNGCATGLAFDYDREYDIPVPTKTFCTMVNRVTFEKNTPIEPDFQKWSKNGILFLNSALTTYKTSYCEDLWKDFYAGLLTYLNNTVNGVLFIFIKSEGMQYDYSELISEDFNEKFFVNTKKDMEEAITKINHKNLALYGEHFNW